jgi:uncharacterized protein YggE
VLSAEEGARGYPIVRPITATAMARVEAVPTPVETGTLDVPASVTLTVEVAPLAR